MVNLAGGKFAIAIFICAVVFSVGAFYFLARGVSSPVRVGEQQVYGIYYQDTKIGTLTIQVNGTVVVENVESFVATYSLSFPTLDRARSGMLKFDAGGNLRRAVIAQAEENTLKWRTEVGYFFADGLMRVIVEDNRNPEDYMEEDTYINLTAEIMVPEYAWYLLRFEPLNQDYRHEFYINLLPNAILNVRAAVQVTGEETVETPVGSWECWVLEGENTQLTSWPIDRIWVAKDSGLVVKGVKSQNGEEIIYLLEEKTG